MSKKKKKRRAPSRGGWLAIGAVVIVAILLAVLSPKTVKDNDLASSAFKLEVTAESDFVINEIMASNASALVMPDGSLPDWIEITNTGNKAHSLSGYVLMLDSEADNMYRLPDVQVAAGESVVVYCDDRPGDMHAPFGLPAAGATAILMDVSGDVVDRVSYPALQDNRVYCRDGGEWVISSVSTPGADNVVSDRESGETTRVTVASQVQISEIMTKNVSYIPDVNGNVHDYIEIENTGSGDINLKGWHLSDDPENIFAWSFPDCTVKAGSSVVVYCSGLDTVDAAGKIHTSFKLSSKGAGISLSKADGTVVDYVTTGEMVADQAYVRIGNRWTVDFAPTPGLPNTAEGVTAISSEMIAKNTSGVILSEICAGSNSMGFDWIELYNSTSAPVDLSGYGLSDNAGHPRKWRFPQGTTIAAGQYMGVILNGVNGTYNGICTADFRLTAAGGYPVTLSDPDGKIIDRIYLPPQFANTSYGRSQNDPALYYFTGITPQQANSAEKYNGRAAQPIYSVPGGLYKTGDVLSVELSCDPGQRVYYTLDNTDPTESSTPYTGPITVTETTVLRARTYGNGLLPSFMDTQTYLYDVNNGNGVYVISLVSDPYNLTSEEAGIMVKGPNAFPNYPYGSMNKGANFWMDWEREGHVEVYGGDGTQLLSQECGLKLHGQYSRAEAQKSFKVIARSEYGGNRFPIALFSDRPYTEYQSFILRASGEDSDKTRMRDSILTDLANGSSVFYQETELCVLYIDGVYWGHYNVRERINTASICQFEGWEGQEDDIDLIKANSNVMQGSNDTFEALRQYVKTHDMTTAEAYAVLDSAIDIQNFIEYMSVEIFTGNTDTLNVKRYRNPNGDGKWRWVLFDLDWAFYTDTNSITRWLTPGGMGAGLRTDNTLFIACMKNPTFRDRFLTYFGEQMATNFSSEHVIQLMQERYAELNPLMDDQLARWNITRGKFESELTTMINYAKSRPMKLLGYIAGDKTLNLSNEQLEKYFGEALRVAQAYTG